MKVSCQSCGAQYNLPDDKVRGRKAKVRCKKCGESIVVDGTAATASNPPGRFFEEEDEATRVMDSPIARSSALWTVNLSDEDQREMTTDEVVSAWVAKEVTDDAYVWRDGMEEWLPILSAPDLVQALRIGDPTFHSAPPGGAGDEARRPPPAGSSPEPTAPAPKVAERPRSEPKAAPVPVAAKSSPLAAPAPTPAPAPTKPQATVEAAKRPMVTAGLFGQIPDKGKPAASKQAARTPGAGGDLFGGTRAPSQPPKAAENSVMFSLDALKAAAAVEERGGRDRDVRVSEDLLIMGGPSGYDLNPAPLIQIDMPPPAAIPIAASASLGGPTAAKPAESPWLSTPVMVVAGLVVVVGAFFGVQAMTSSKPTPDVSAVSAAGERKAAEVTPEAPSAEPAGDSKPATSAAAEPSAAAAAAPSAPPANAGATPAVAAAPKPAGGGTPKPAGGGGGGGGATPKPAAEPAGGKGGFNVGAAKEALGAAASQAKLCKSGDGPTGSGKVQITFAPSGRVTVANVVGGPFAGTSVGGCVARAFRGARVPAFDGAPQTVSKGFSIN